jgi:tripartite-type tricarboxylate transporter receptor subunit TctC
MRPGRFVAHDAAPESKEVPMPKSPLRPMRRHNPTAAMGALICVAVMAAFPADAQTAFPSRPVKLLMSLPAGSAPDIRTRIIAEFLTKAWNQHVVVENKPGGGGSIGVQSLLSAAADGHTLLVAPVSTFTILPAQKAKLGFDVTADLIPIGLTSNEAMLIAASSKLGVSSLADLIALAGKQPHKVIIGTNPAGTLPFLAARLLVETSKAPMSVLPYASGGTSEATRDLLGGRIHVVIEGRPGLKGALESGELRALAIMSAERHPNLPDLPTAAETVPGLTAVGWQVLVAPKGTPDSVVAQLVADLRKALEAPDLRTRLERIGMPFRPLFSDELVRFIEREQKLWWPLVKASASSERK